MNAVVFDNDGNEVIGTIGVLKVMHDEGAARPYHLELEIPDDLLDELVMFGSEVFGQLDLLHAGIRGALLERIAKENEK